MAKGVNYYDGSSWVEVATVEDGNGNERQVKRWDGSKWVKIFPRGTVIDDFEDGDTTTKSADWGGWVGDTSALSAQQSTVLGGSYSGELTANTTSSSINTTRTSNIQKGLKFTVEISNDTGDSSNGVQFRLKTSGNARFGTIRFVDNGAITWAFSTNIRASWSTNTVYNIECVFDFANDEVEIIINGTSEGVFSFSSSVSGFGKLDVINRTLNGSGGARSLYFDDIIAAG